MLANSEPGKICISERAFGCKKGYPEGRAGLEAVQLLRGDYNGPIKR